MISVSVPSFPRSFLRAKKNTPGDRAAFVKQDCAAMEEAARSGYAGGMLARHASEKILKFAPVYDGYRVRPDKNVRAFLVQMANTRYSVKKREKFEFREVKVCSITEVLICGQTTMTSV